MGDGAKTERLFKGLSEKRNERWEITEISLPAQRNHILSEKKDNEYGKERKKA